MQVKSKSTLNIIIGKNGTLRTLNVVLAIFGSNNPAFMFFNESIIDFNKID